MKQRIHPFALLAACVLLAVPRWGAARAASATPVGITTADKVETRIGTLEFKDGVPSKTTAEKAYDNLDFTYAFRAFMDNMRGVSIHALRNGMQDIGVKDNKGLVFSELMDAKSLFLTANADKVEVIPISGASPFDTCVADNPESQEGEVFPDSEVEPWVAVNPLNKRHIVVTWQQDRWSTGGARGIVTAVTFNSGLSRTQVQLPGLTPCTGSEEYLRASDPWLAFTPTGDLYHITLAVDGDLITLLSLGFPDEGRSAMLVQKSTDGGLTWSSPIAIVDETFAGLHDKETITADPFDGDVVYAVWDRLDFLNGGGPAFFSRTIDGGMTWENPTVIYDPPNGQTLGNQIVVLPNGDVLDFFSNIEFIDVEPMEEIISLAYKRSTDLGMTWTPFEAPFTVSSIEPSFSLADPDTGVPIRGGEELFDVAVDHKRGTLYAVWQDGRFGKELHESIAFSASEDGGFTWSPPIEINQTPKYLPVKNQQAFVPSVSVNAGGLIAITYYDFRFNDDGPEALTDMWAITCRPGKRGNCLDARDWREIRLTNESFDLSTAPLAGGLFLGDYDGLASAGKNFAAVFSVSSITDPADVVFVRFNKTWARKEWKTSVHGRPPFHGHFPRLRHPQRRFIRDVRTSNTSRNGPNSAETRKADGVGDS